MDRDHYFAGEAVWCKGYFMSGFLPSVSSTVLYIELVNSHSEMVQRSIFPVYGGMAPAQFTLPDSLSTGSYQIRAYAPLMLNQPGFTFNRSITVYGKEKKRINRDDAQKGNKLLFFPEGGNFIAGILNTVAFKSVDKGGMPVPVEGTVRNSKGARICALKSLHDGMGSFSMVPVKGETYYATVNQSGEKYFLPPQADEGIGFNITDAPGMKRFKITKGDDNDLFKPAYMIGQVQNHVIFRQLLQGDRKEISGSIKTSDFYSGILQLTLFNKDDMPLAERITFVDNKEYMLPVTIHADTLDTGKRKHNHFTITLPDTVIGNFSLSVTDADYETEENRPGNIYASFLLSSDIKGYVHNPAYYFNTSGDSARQALDLVMMTNGWTRFRWSDIVQNRLPQPLYKDPGYIKIRGKVKGPQKKAAGNALMLFISPPDSTGFNNSISRMLYTDSLGQFEADSLFFYGKRQLLFSSINGKKNAVIRVQLDGDSLNRRYPVAPVSMPFHTTTNASVQEKMEAAYNAHMNTEGITLENINVHSTARSPLDQLDAEYSSGLFSGATHSIRLDLRNEGHAGDIFQYLRERVSGLKVSGESGDYVLHYRGGNVLYYIANGEEVEARKKPDPHSNTGNVTLFLNEMPSNPVALETVPLSDIALVKLFPTSTAAAGGGAVLSVYTKKGKDLLVPAPASADIITYEGYTIVKEFFNPEYTGNPVNNTTDHRITLQWVPDIFVNGSNTIIPVTFYNNDQTKRFKIVAEGIASDGRMLMLEKIIEPR